MSKRTLEQIEEDLHKCAEYNTIGTVQAAFRYCNDLRVNMLDLVACVQRLKGPEGPGLLLQPEGEPRE